MFAASGRHPEQVEGARGGHGPREQGTRHRQLPRVGQGPQLARRSSCQVMIEFYLSAKGFVTDCSAVLYIQVVPSACELRLV